MSAIEEIEKRLLALPLRHRVFLAESLLASVPLAQAQRGEEDEIAEAERRERDIEAGLVGPLTDAEFWTGVEADLKKCS